VLHGVDKVQANDRAPHSEPGLAGRYIERPGDASINVENLVNEIVWVDDDEIPEHFLALLQRKPGLVLVEDVEGGIVVHGLDSSRRLIPAESTRGHVTTAPVDQAAAPANHELAGGRVLLSVVYGWQYRKSEPCIPRAELGNQVEDQDLREWISKLGHEEHELFRQEAQGGVTDAMRKRGRELEEYLDQCWDLLRQRRANHDALSEEKEMAKVIFELHLGWPLHERLPELVPVSLKLTGTGDDTKCSNAGPRSASYAYDARDRLVNTYDGHGGHRLGIHARLVSSRELPTEPISFESAHAQHR